MKEVLVATPPHAYRVLIGSDVYRGFVQSVHPVDTIILASDQNVAGHHGLAISELLRAQGVKVLDWLIPPGEESKSLWQAECFYDFLGSQRVDRQAVIVALGGGVVGDLAGFVAGTWLRGVRWVYCPTSLLSCVDASVGGKTALNLGGIKNCVGTIHQPRLVLIDPERLQTLPEREFSCGMAESLKHGLVLDEVFFDWQERHIDSILRRDPAILEELIYRNVALKTSVVVGDERDEMGQRAQLNFGHTVGHALESATRHQLSHGEAIALGMQAAMLIAVNRRWFNVTVLERVRKVIRDCSLPIEIQHPLDMSEFMLLLQADKKTRDGQVQFVLPKQIGQVVVGQTVSFDEIQQAVTALMI